MNKIGLNIKKIAFLKLVVLSSFPYRCVRAGEVRDVVNVIPEPEEQTIFLMDKKKHDKQV